MVFWFTVGVLLVALVLVLAFVVRVRARSDPSFSLGSWAVWSCVNAAGILGGVWAGARWPVATAGVAFAVLGAAFMWWSWSGFAVPSVSPPGDAAGRCR